MGHCRLHLEQKRLPQSAKLQPSKSSWWGGSFPQSPHSPESSKWWLSAKEVTGGWGGDAHTHLKQETNWLEEKREAAVTSQTCYKGGRSLQQPGRPQEAKKKPPPRPKLKMYNSNVLSTLLYRAQAWQLKQTEEKMLLTASVHKRFFASQMAATS